MSSSIKKSVLDNGLTILSEQIPHLRSVSLGIWLKKGSRDESPDQAGIYHFIEHMLFKGTRKRTSFEIAKLFDAIGGYSDAFTSKENTCFYAKVLDEHLPVVLDLFSDILQNPQFSKEDIERERKVIHEEIRMVEDTPSDLVHELFVEHFWGDHPLGRPILGTTSTVDAMSQDLVRKAFYESYVPENMVISAAGNLEHESLVDDIRKYFPYGGVKQPTTYGSTGNPPEPRPSVVVRSKKELEQSHVCLGVMAHSVNHPDRFVSSIMNVILGGSMSSRMFQKIREEMGLCYTVFSSLNFYQDSGYMNLYAATAGENVKTATELMLQECKLLVDRPVDDEELENAKNHLKGSLILGLESSSSRMFNLAKNDIYHGRQVSTDELLADISRVTVDDIQRVSRELFSTSEYGVVVVGDPGDFDIRIEDLKIGRR